MDFKATQLTRMINISANNSLKMTSWGASKEITTRLDTELSVRQKKKEIKIYGRAKTYLGLVPLPLSHLVKT